MTSREDLIRRKIVESGVRLCESGLTERTWGNISARLDDSHFIITPSGRAYVDTREDDLVTISLSDLSYEGKVIPSSEKAMHAAIYRLCPDVNFVLHTHQTAATVCGCSGDLTLGENAVLGPLVPCADYALPSTERLAENVAAAALRVPGACAVLMRGHGVVCFGLDCDAAFLTAAELERICGGRVAGLWQSAGDGGKKRLSLRRGDYFAFDDGSGKSLYLPEAARYEDEIGLHASAYCASDARCVVHITSAPVLAVSRLGVTLLPYVDDLAQIAGESIRCARDRHELPQKLEGRAAVLMKDNGALCLGGDREDAEAAAAILEKNCLAELYARRHSGCEPISAEHARVLREVYLTIYSKRKGAKG